MAEPLRSGPAPGLPTCDHCGKIIGEDAPPDFHMDPETLAVTCGDCWGSVTGAPHPAERLVQRLDADRCSRCGRERPADAAAQGWTVFENERGEFLRQLCPGCHTADEQTAGWPDYPPDEGASR